MTDIAAPASPAVQLSRAVQLAISFFAIGVPTLYALGRAYDEGYWDAVQLPQLASHAVEDYVYLGFLMLLNGTARLVGAQGIVYWLVAGLVLTLFACYVVVLEKWFIPIVVRRFRRIRARTENPKWAGPKWVGHLSKPLFVAWGAVTSVGLLVLVLFSTVAVPVVGMHKAGQDQARRDRNRLVAYGSEPKLGAEPVVHYDERGESRTALMLRCDGAWCVVFEHGSFAAVKVEAVQRIDHCPRRSRLQNGYEVCTESTSTVP